MSGKGGHPPRANPPSGWPGSTPGASRPRKPEAGFCLLPGHGDADEFLRVDQVVVVVFAEVDLHEVDLAIELAGTAGVVGADGHAEVFADVSSFVGGEDQGLGGIDSSFAGLLAVVVERDVAAPAEATAVVGDQEAK
jgi:hypothetical protein